MITFLLAGHETTANALVWTFWLLGQHPQAAARLRTEIDAVLGERPPTLDDLPRLGYVRMVLEEAMRLYPPVWVVDRNTVAEDVIGGHRIGKGTLVMLSQYVTHRHPAFWPDPERFDPDRFAPAAARARPRYAYFPFIGGPRMCIGAQFAMTEATLILACLARRFALAPIAGEPVEPNPSVTLRPRHGAPMRVTALESPKVEWRTIRLRRPQSARSTLIAAPLRTARSACTSSSAWPQMLQGLASRHSSAREIGVGPKPIAIASPSGQKASSPGSTTSLAPASRPAIPESGNRPRRPRSRRAPRRAPRRRVPPRSASRAARPGSPRCRSSSSARACLSP